MVALIKSKIYQRNVCRLPPAACRLPPASENDKIFENCKKLYLVDFTGEFTVPISSGLRYPLLWCSHVQYPIPLFSTRVYYGCLLYRMYT